MRHDLNRNWLFLRGRHEEYIITPIKGGEKVQIPHNVEIFPASYLCIQDYQGEFTYQLQFDCHDELPTKILTFDGVMLQFDAYINGNSLGHFVSGFLPVSIDVSKYIQKKNNILTIIVDGREDPHIPPFGKVVDYLTFAGIYREVRLDSHPASYIQDLFIRASSNGDIEIQTEIVGSGSPDYEIYDGETLILKSKDTKFHLDNPHLYSLDDPHQYEIKATLGDDAKKVHFGFRDVEFKIDGFFLNGKRVELIGLNRHQSYPYFGMAAPKSLQEEDADILKSIGLNVVRTSHYPQSEHFLSRCDEIGLLVLNEIPGWQFISKDEIWRRNCVDFARKMIIKERNHPSLIAYGLRIDESGDDDELYSEIQRIKDELDPHRQSLGVRNFKDSNCLEDVYAYNDFSGDRLIHGVDPSKEILGGDGKPKLISESNGHMYPTKPYDPTDRRIEHALRHARVLDDIMGDQGYVGGISWCAFDYNTHPDFGSGDLICHHGVYDIFRNKKYAASFYASQRGEPYFEIASSVKPGDFDEALLPKIVVFTNADYVELYRGKNRIGKFYPDKETYPNLPHPPIVIDDIIGETFDEKGINAKDSKKIVEAFNYCSQNGFNRLRLRDKILLARLSAKYRLSFTDIYQAYAKYTHSWGEENAVWRFLAYKDGSRIGEILRGPSTSFHYSIASSKEVLVHGPTYDCLRLQIEKLDQWNTRTPYAFDAIKVETEGPIEVYGPSFFSLNGGASSIYIRSKEGKFPAEGIIKILTTEENLEMRILVKSDS